MIIEPSFKFRSVAKAMTNQRHIPNSTDGFTLVETIVAFGLLLAALVGPVSLITQGLVSAGAAKNKLIAAHLAQEGIELMHAVRDNNISCEALDAASPVEWNSAPGGTGALNGRYELDAFDTIPLQCPNASQEIPQTPRPSLINCSVSPRPLLLGSAGQYTYVSGAPTAFSRCVHVCSPPNSGACQAFSGTDADADISEAGDQMEIISEVTWAERGAQKNFTLRERLYNWR